MLTKPKFDRLREVETKHGRIAQLAILGHLITTAGYRLPTCLTPGYDLSSTKAGLAALTDLPAEAIFGTLLTVAVIDGGFAARKYEICQGFVFFFFNITHQLDLLGFCKTGVYREYNKLDKIQIYNIPVNKAGIN